MPDVTMCEHKACLRSPSCVRHADSGTLPSPFRQGYFLRPLDFNTGTCEDYWMTNHLPVEVRTDSYPVPKDAFRL